MKIAIWHNLPGGGGKRALYYHTKGLIERGHQVEVWCPSTSDQTYLPLQDLAAVHVIPFNWMQRMTRNRISEVLVGYQNAVQHIAAMTAACQQCAAEIHQGSFDLLFANTCHFYGAPFITRYVDLPRVLYLQEPHRPLYEANNALPWIAEPNGKDWSVRFRLFSFYRDYFRIQALRIQAREEWHNAHAADRILVNSYFSQESVRRVYGMDATVCYLGIDTSLFRNLHQAREPFIVGLGSFFPNKGLGFALESIALLPEPRPRLVWIGNSGPESYIEEKLQQAKMLSVDLEIKRIISDEEIVDILNRARLLLYTPYLEPFGFAPLEANACGTPVIAVVEGGIRETVRDGVNGLLVARKSKAVAAAIRRLWDDPALACRLGENGRVFVEGEWNLDQSINLLENYLQDTIAAKGSQVAA